VSTVPDIWDDDELLAALRQALEERRTVPLAFVEAAKNAFAWRSIDIDVELAELTYDSSRDAETASIRALTFTSAHLTIEVEVTHDSLLGQIVPAQPGTIKVLLRDGAESTVTADGIGRFIIRPIPTGTFRLHCKTSADADALTGWITL